MPITIDWVDEERQDILQFRFAKQWTWLEFRQAVNEALVLIQARAHPVDLIFDLQNCHPLHRFDGMTHIWYSLRQYHLTEPAYIVLISRDPNVRVLASVIRHSQPRLREHLLVVETEAEAHAALAHYRG